MKIKTPYIKFVDRYKTILTPKKQNEYIETLYNSFRLNSKIEIKGKIEKATIIEPHGNIDRKNICKY